MQGRPLTEKLQAGMYRGSDRNKRMHRLNDARTHNECPSKQTAKETMQKNKTVLSKMARNEGAPMREAALSEGAKEQKRSSQPDPRTTILPSLIRYRPTKNLKRFLQ